MRTMKLRLGIPAACLAIAFAATLSLEHSLLAAEKTDSTTTVFKTPEEAWQGFLCSGSA